MNEQETPQQQAVAIAKQPAKDIRALIQSPQFESAVAAALPKHLTKERFVRVALNAIMRQPELLDCTKESFFLCMLELSALGIEPDGRRAHLIPFRNNNICGACGHEKDQHQRGVCRVQGCKNQNCGNMPSALICTKIIDYKGLAELVRRSGDVSYMHCDVVYAGDDWEFEYGTNAHLTHKPNFEKQNRNITRAIYSYVKLRDGNEDFIVMSPAEVEEIRSKSKYPNGKPWKESWGEMAKKTSFRRHSKWLPLSAEVRDAVEADDDVIDMEGAFTISTDNVPPNADRLEQQMKEQAEAAGPVRETKQPEAETKTAAGETNGSKAEPHGPPWETRDAMLDAFDFLRGKLPEKRFFDVLGSNGASSYDDLNSRGENTIKAYEQLLNELQASLADAGAGSGVKDAEPDFRPRGRR